MMKEGRQMPRPWDLGRPFTPYWHTWGLRNGKNVGEKSLSKQEQEWAQWWVLLLRVRSRPRCIALWVFAIRWFTPSVSWLVRRYLTMKRIAQGTTHMRRDPYLLLLCSLSIDTILTLREPFLLKLSHPLKLPDFPNPSPWKFFAVPVTGLVVFSVISLLVISHILAHSITGMKICSWKSLNHLLFSSLQTEE